MNNYYYDLFRTDSFLMLNKKAIKILGLINTAYLSVLVDKDYYLKEEEKEDGYFYFLEDYQGEELKLGIKAIRTCRKFLEDLEIIETKKMGMPARLFYRINYEKLVGLIYEENFDNENNSYAAKRTQVVPSRQDMSCPPGRTVLYNITRTKKLKQRREEIIFLNFFPKEWVSNYEFCKTWTDWENHRKEIKKKLSPTSVKEQKSFLLKYPINEAIEIIKSSIKNGWAGLFPLSPDKEKREKPSKFKSTSKTIKIK